MTSTNEHHGNTLPAVPTATAKPEQLPALNMADGVFASAQAFELGQRMANGLARSALVPKDYQNNVANCLIALDLAARMRLSPMVVLQGLNVIHGRPTWSSTFVMAAINASGLFSPLRFEFRGTEGKDDWACRATASDRSTGELCFGPWVSVQMAKAEGWYSRNGSKWPTMTELMLRYRAAAFFGRAYASHLLAGMVTAEEAQEIGQGAMTTTQAGSAPAAPLAAVEPVSKRVARRAAVAKGEVVDVEPKAPAEAAQAPAPAPAADPPAEHAEADADTAEHEPGDGDRAVFGEFA